MSVMIDSNVLIHLISEEPDKATDPDLHEQWLASREMVATEGTIHLSAIVWFEAWNMRTEDGSEVGVLLSQVEKNLIVEPLHIDAAERASKLLGDKQLCPHCFAHPDDKPCTGCGKLVGKNLKLNDALIVAHAEVTAGVTALYTYDKKMITLGGSTRTDLNVANPPATTGAPVSKRYRRLSITNAPEDVASGDSLSIPIVVDEDAGESGSAEISGEVVDADEL